MKDPGIEEVRQARHEISEECGHDLHRVVSYYKQIEQELRQSGDFRFEEMSNAELDPQSTSIQSSKKVAA